MNPDPTATTVSWNDILAMIQNVVLIITGVIGSIIAIIGYRDWHKQLKGTDSYSIGKKVIAALSDFRDAIDHVRSPFMFRGEMDLSDEESKKYNEQEKKAREVEKAYSARIKTLNTARRDLIIALKECETILGIGYVTNAAALHKIYAKVVTAIEMHIDEMGRSYYGREFTDEDKKWRNEQRGILYCIDENSDPLRVEMLREITKLEEQIRRQMAI